jgi:hypothetical protein
MPGVFAAGDVRHGSVKRVASAVGEGSIAIQQVHAFLASRKLDGGHDGDRIKGSSRDGISNAAGSDMIGAER